MSFRIVSGADSATTHKLSMARLIAGEWQAGYDDRLVTIEEIGGRRRRWKATLEQSGNVRMDSLYSDPECADESRRMRKANRRARVAAIAVREAKRAATNQPPPMPQSASRPVVRLSDGKEFPSVYAAAVAEMVAKPTMFRRLRDGRKWAYKSDIMGVTTKPEINAVCA